MAKLPADEVSNLEWPAEYEPFFLAMSLVVGNPQHILPGWVDTLHRHHNEVSGARPLRNVALWYILWYDKNQTQT